MGTVRALLRLGAATVHTGAIFLCWLICRPLIWIAPSAGVRVHDFWNRIWARGMAWIVGMKVRCEGRTPVPPFFLVSNHLSYMDVVAIRSRVDGLFLAKAEIARWPVIGLISRAVGTLFIDNSRKGDLPRAIEEVEAALALDQGVILFPEGGNQIGDRVHPFKASVFEVPHRTGHPVHCASVSYRTEDGEPPAHRVICWWGGEGFLPHFFRLLRLPSFEASLRFSEIPVRADDRKGLAREAQRAVEELFVPVVRPEEVEDHLPVG